MEVSKNKKPVRTRFFEPTCPKLVPKYEWKVDEDGHHYLEKIGEYDADAEIQLYKDSCDIKIIIDRMMRGDAATISMLASPGIYGDVNDFPQDVHPRAYAQGLAQLYENQPRAVKDKFPTYEKFAEYFTNLTEAMVGEMFKSQEEVKEPSNGEQ